MHKRTKTKIVKIDPPVSNKKVQVSLEELEALRKDIQHCFHIVRA